MAEGTTPPCAATAQERGGAVHTPEFGAAAPAPLQQKQHQQLSALAPSSGLAGSSSSSSSSSGSSGGSSCCDAVYAQRMAAFKSHPSAATCRTRRMELNALLRSQTRGDLLRQLREEAEQQLQQQVELLTQQDQQRTALQICKKDSEGKEEQTTPVASGECTDSRPLQHMLTHPQPIYELPEELKAGEYMVALRPEGRACLLLIRNGKGRVCDKNGETLYRVHCSKNTHSRTAAESLPAHVLQLQQQQEQQQQQHQRLPLRLEELQQLQSEESLFLPPVEKQRLLLEGARVFDVSHLEPHGGTGEHDQGEGPIAADTPQKDVISPWRAFRDPGKQQYRKQQRKVPPLLFLPCGVLSKGLTLLECVLCPYTPASVKYFSERFAAGSGDAAAAAAAATAAAAPEPVVITSSEIAALGAAGGREEPMFILMFVTDVLFLGGLMMGHCEFECRHFFLKSRMEEAPMNFHPLQFLPFVEATASHLHLLFSGPFLYPPDGFIFQHKLSPHIAGVNTLALCWRHEQISRFPIDEKNLGRFHVDAFLWVHPDGHVFSEDGVTVGEVDPQEFGVAALSAPVVMRCWAKELDVQSGRFRSVQMAFQESPAHCRAPKMGTKPLQYKQDFHRGDRTMDSVESTGSAPPDAGSVAAEEAAAAAETGTQRREGRRPRLRQRFMKGRSADCYAKLADQWLRIEGIHPVPFEVLCDSCPP